MSRYITKGLIEREETVIFWGKEYRITPRLITSRFGNGRRLIYLTPLNTRPNYYVVRVDSRWELDNHAAEGPYLIDHLDEIYEAIEEQYGNARCGSCDALFGGDSPCSECEDRPEADGQFPALDDENGSSWGVCTLDRP